MIFISFFITNVSPDSFSPSPFISYSLPVWILLNMLYLLLVFYKKKYWLISGVFFLVGLFGLKNTFALNVFQKEGDLRVMSYNVRLFDVYNWVQRKTWDDWEERKDDGLILDSIYRTIRFENPDIISFQEFYNEPLGEYKTKRELKRKQGYSHVNDSYSFKEKGSQYGMATFSKFPIIYKEFIAFQNKQNNGVLISDIVKDFDTIRVLNVHLQSFKLGNEHYTYLRSLKDSTIDALNIPKTKQLASQLYKGFKKRTSQMKLVLEQVKTSPYPVIICGDLNETALSYVYEELTDNLCDAFLEAGNGLGITHTSGYPFMRIDYILTSPGVKPVSFHVVEKELSDHFPIVAEISFED